MIEKILERLEAERKMCLKESALISASCIERMKEIVQEVAKEYGWIPVETALPNNYEFVYATCISLVDNREPWVIECVYYKELGGFETASPMISWGDAKVIAWMPRKFPAPYQKGE